MPLAKREAGVRAGGLALRAAALLASSIVALGACESPPGTGGPTASTAPSSPSPRSEPCPRSLQAAVDAAPTGATLDLGGCTYAAGATISRPLTLVGATVHPPAGAAAVTVAADDVTLERLTITGAQAITFDIAEIGVVARGTPEKPIRRLAVRDSEISMLGGFGVYLAGIEDVRLQANDVHDVVYAGLMVLSSTGGVVDDNVIRRIGVEGSAANQGNAYGIALTTRPGGDVPTSDVVVRGNTVEDVPTWHALDTHGGRGIAFEANTVRRSMRGIFVTSDDAGNRPTRISIVDNRLLSPSPVSSNLAAVTLYLAVSVTITGNVVEGWGAGNFVRDFESGSSGVVIDGNAVSP